MTERNRGLIGGLVMTLLAWLGLAGLSDAIVDWQDWFEQGIMEHWRSVKEWVTAILLWWLPFKVPFWLIDYAVISTIVVRASPIPRWNEHWRFGPTEALKTYGYIPFTWRMEWAMSHVFTRLPVIILLFLTWPLALPFLFVEAIRGKAFAPDIGLDPGRRRAALFKWLKSIAWCFFSFIPVLFVISTVLYEHG